MAAGEEFWGAAAEMKPLSVEDVETARDAMLEQLRRPRPSRCAHVHPYSYVKKLRDQGITETHCRQCGQWVRV